jgi:hypothetical protein
MATEATEATGRLGRRAVIAAGIGGMVAAMAGALGRPAAVMAADGDPVKIGEMNAGTKTTFVSGGPGEGVHGVSAGADGLVGEASVAVKSGVYGFTSHAGGYGVAGRNKATGAVASLGGPLNAVRGDLNRADVAVYGENAHGGGQGVGGRNMANGSKGFLGGFDGVWGETTQSIRSGVYGRTLHEDGFGVVGHNDLRGTEGHLGGVAGVVAKPGLHGPALSVEGPCVFRDAGVVMVAAGSSSVTVSGVGYEEIAPFVLATLQKYRAGVYVAAAVPNKPAGTLTIYLNKKVTTAIAVGYWVAS